MVQSLVAKLVITCHVGLHKQTFDDGELACRFSIIYQKHEQSSLSVPNFFKTGKNGGLTMTQHLPALQVCVCAGKHVRVSLRLFVFSP